MDTAVERGSREIEERQTLGAGQQQPRLSTNLRNCSLLSEKCVIGRSTENMQACFTLISLVSASLPPSFLPLQ
jgi:hypothetical protein